MIIPLPKSFTFFTGCIRHFAKTLGLSLTHDEALDIAGHIWSDDFYRALHDPADWHVILWNRDVAQTYETYSLARSDAQALATVLAVAEDEGQEIGSVEPAKDGFVVRLGNEIYATITRPAYETPRPDLLRRMETLLAPILIADEQGLLRRLEKMKGWPVAPRHVKPLYSDIVVPLGSPRNGEWLPPLSYTHSDKARSDNNLEEYLDAWEFRTEQNRLPMWITPSSLARTLQTLLSEHLTQRPKLSLCQEALAEALGLSSWQLLVSRFRQCIFLQVTRQCVTGDEMPQMRFYRTPAELLACFYGDALQRLATSGSRVHLTVGWLMGSSLNLEWRDCSIDDIRAKLALSGVLVPEKTGADSEEYFEAAQKWCDQELALRCAANEWQSDETYLKMCDFSDEHLRQAIELLGLSVPPRFLTDRREHP